MAIQATGVLRRGNRAVELLEFLLQALIAISIEVGDDLGRGLISQHGSLQGVLNARSVVFFEATHGFWVEPAWQTFFEHTHRVLVFSLTWADTMRAFNAVYVLGHVCVTLSVAFWVYFFRRPYFALLRNTIILINVIALIIYEAFPVAPPRLTTGLTFHNHPFTFQDTVYGLLSSTGRVGGTPVGYNEFSAMPSVHMAWALVVSVALLWLGRGVWPRLSALVYPALMFTAIVVTANHYILDAAVAVAVVALAFGMAWALDEWWSPRATGSGDVGLLDQAIVE